MLTLREQLETTLICYALSHGNGTDEGDPRKVADKVIELCRLIIRAEREAA